MMSLAATTLSSSSSQESDEESFVVVPTGKLHNGVVVPLVGLGCASGVRQQHVSSALSIGYRFLDTAQSYNWGYHEDEVGTAVRNFEKKKQMNNDNDDIFVQTKIHPEDLGYEATKRAVSKSLQRMGVSKLDSVLIHKPRCWEGACTRVPEGTWQDSWKALEELYESGVIEKAIGICDVSSDNLLNELLTQRIKPHVIQNWMDPLHQDKSMRDKIQSHGILYQAYSSLGTQWFHHKGHKTNPVTNHPVLLEIAKAHAADAGRVVVQWATVRHGISVLPASTNPSRQQGNLLGSFAFRLTEEELDRIDGLDGKIPPATNPDDVSIRFLIDHNDDDEDSSASAAGVAAAVDVYWVNHDTGEEVSVGSVVRAGKALSLGSFHGHTFRFRDNNGAHNNYHDFTIDKEDGNRQVHVIAPGTDNDDEDDEEL